jgi:2-oxoisovalerate dehydrogenase E1 component
MSIDLRIEKNVLLQLYRTMLVVRKTELQLAKSHSRGLIHGACHTYVGQEAIAAGVCGHLTKDDIVFSSHRGHGHALAKGVKPFELIAELFGRADGCSRGRGGSMHLFSPEVGMLGTSGIVGPCILQAAGGGYSFKLLRRNHVSVAFFGDGAVNNGAFHEGLNLASIWNLPVLFVCENNQYATEVPFSYSSGSPNVGDRGAAYGMPSQILDGNDVSAVYEAAGTAIQRARDGEGPTLLECRTYRTRAHAEGMAELGYRTQDEVDHWKARCPIQRLRAELLQLDVSEAALTGLESEVTADTQEAAHRAEQSPYPAAENATTHLFAAPKPAPRQVPAGTREVTYMDATLEALTTAMTEDPTIFVLGEGIGSRGGNFNSTTGLYDRFGALRLCDTPICERGFVGLAGGAAMSGTRPVVDFMFSDFILDAVGEIVNQIAKMQYMSSGRLKMPIVLRGCGGVGHSAATHHSGIYYAMYAQFPGIRVVVPSNPYDAKGLFLHALRGDDPVIMLEHREILNIKGPVPEQPYEIPFGKAAVVREGTDVSVVALSRMVHYSLEAANTLAAMGISVEIVDPRTISPLDIDTILGSVAKTGRLLIVDETYGPLGVGAEIAAQIADIGFDELDAPIRRLNGKHTPTPYSPSLEKAVVPHVEDVVAAIKDLLEE